ncbi:hypothetical protein [Streptomyces sp. NBC_01190]|uniref:hypothetical protein n=1 Tax=Streptomyces sp. NBC_01190 TaxID=2903767 RepID=UPI00386B8DBB|nr:hypothetical protein OG519_33775 [Streptomyces sp. NBC_01190]
MTERICPRCRHLGEQHCWWAHRPDGVICPGCHLTERITELLDDGTGQVAPSLLPLHRAVCTQPNPGTGLVWLAGNRHIAPLLAGLATGRLPLKHETFDDHPSPQSVMHLRDLLVQHPILEHRDRYLVLFENWLRRTLDTIQLDEDLQLVRRFATWHSLRQLRQRAAREPLAPGLTARHRREINSACIFLAWLREHGATPPTCTQAQLDAWITTGNSSRQDSRAFIVWAGKNGSMARHLRLPYHQRTPRDTITQEQRLQLLRGLLDPHANTFLRDRAAALLLALFAQPLTRIAALTMDDLDLSSDEVRITLGPHGPVPVPEPFGQVLRDHAENRGPRNITANRVSPWLFPGNRPGQHIHSTYLMNQLAKNGIHLLGTRLAAIRALVQEMPPAVAAQALGYTAECAEDHAIQAGARWATYASHRRQPDRQTK